jgi:hypothetical protein
MNMKRVLILMTVMLVMVFAWSVDSGASSKSAKEEVAVDESPALCGHCGEIKSGEKCCVADAVKCGGCKLVKGSPGCCTIEPGKDVALCSHCGQIAGSDECCDLNAKKCGGCGLAKGSPGCCTI